MIDTIKLLNMYNVQSILLRSLLDRTSESSSRRIQLTENERDLLKVIDKLKTELKVEMLVKKELNK